MAHEFHLLSMYSCKKLEARGLLSLDHTSSYTTMLRSADMRLETARSIRTHGSTKHPILHYNPRLMDILVADPGIHPAFHLLYNVVSVFSTRKA